MSALSLLLALSLAAEPEAVGSTATEPDAVEAAETEGLAETEGPERSLPPAVQRADWMDLDEPVVHEVGDARVWYVRVPGVRKVEVAVTVRGGSYDLDGHPSEAVTAMYLMAHGTSTRDPVALEIETDLNDIRLRGNIGHHSGTVRISAPKESLDLALELLGETLRSPAYPKKEVKQQQRDRLNFLTVDAPTSLSRVAWAAAAYAWYPADHPYGWRPDLKGLKKVSTDALIDKHAAWLGAGPVTALVVGDVDFETVRPGLEAAVADLGADEEWSEEVPFEAPEKTRVIAVDMPGQAQTALRLRYAAPARLHEDRVAFDAMSWVLGGHFLSRLNANLREENGFTYGAGASYSYGDLSGVLTVYVDVKAENTRAAIEEIERELGRLVDGGITPEERGMALEAVLADWNGTRETARSAAWFYEEIQDDRETVAEALARGKQLADLEAGAVQGVAEQWLGEAPHVWVVVGDRALIADQLDALGWDPVWVTPEEAVLGTF